MTVSAESPLPKLRSVDARPVRHMGRLAIMLRDPLRLSDKTAVIPQQLAPLLQLCDGTRDVDGLRAAVAVRYGLPITREALERLLVAFDEALLLQNDRFLEARQQALEEYRRGPFRPPALAGESYPDDPGELRQALSSYLAAAEENPGELGGARGLVCPHIDYPRGGHVYGRVWMAAAGAVKEADLVVLLGTDHYGGDARVTLTRQHYATPFGVLPTSQDVVGSLAAEIGEETAFAEELHHRSEHSIELAAVWLHHIREGEPCELVPILCGSFGAFVQGDADLDGDPTINATVHALRQSLSGRSAVVVAAADLSHVGPAFGGQPVDLLGRARLQESDDELLDLVCGGDARGFFEAIQRVGDQRNVCGLPPIYLALQALSPTQGETMSYDRCPADERGTSLVSVCGIVLT
jgi:AmmeMemoRadiSam system protein B